MPDLWVVRYRGRGAERLTVHSPWDRSGAGRRFREKGVVGDGRFVGADRSRAIVAHPRA